MLGHAETLLAAMGHLITNESWAAHFLPPPGAAGTKLHAVRRKHDQRERIALIVKRRASANSLLGMSMSIPPIVTLGPLQVPHNIGILSRKGERMPWGAAQEGANAQRYFHLSGDPFMLFDHQSERADGASKRQAIHPDQANTMKVRRELVHHHVPT